MKVPRYLMRTEVTVSEYAGETAIGPTYSDPETLRGHWEGRRRMVTDQEGRQVVASVTFIVDSDAAIGMESKVTKAGVDYRVVEIVTNDAGLSGAPSHLEVLLTPSRETSR